MWRTYLPEAQGRWLRRARAWGVHPTGSGCSPVESEGGHRSAPRRSPTRGDGYGALAEVVLREADGRLASPLERTARCVQNRARLVQALYTRLDRLTEPAGRHVAHGGGAAQDPRAYTHASAMPQLRATASHSRACRPWGATPLARAAKGPGLLTAPGTPGLVVPDNNGRNPTKVRSLAEL